MVPLVREGTQLYQRFPELVADARAGRGPIGGLLDRFTVLEFLERNSEQLQEYASGLGAPTLAFLRGAATTVAGIVTIFVLAYLMVLEAPRIVDGSLGGSPHDASDGRPGGDPGRPGAAGTRRCHAAAGTGGRLNTEKPAAGAAGS